MSQNRVGCNCCTESVLPCQDSDGVDTGCPDTLSFDLTIPSVNVYHPTVEEGFACCITPVSSFAGGDTLNRGWCSNWGFGCSCSWGTNDDAPNASIGLAHPNWHYEFVAENEPSGNLSLESGIVEPDWSDNKYAADNFNCISPQTCYEAGEACCAGEPISTWDRTGAAGCSCDAGETHRWYRAAMGLAWNVQIGLNGLFGDILPYWTLTLTIASVRGDLESIRNCVPNGYDFWGATSRYPPSFNTIPTFSFGGGWKIMQWKYRWDATFDPCNLNIYNTGATIISQPSTRIISGTNTGCDGNTTNGGITIGGSHEQGYFGFNEPFTPTWSLG